MPTNIPYTIALTAPVRTIERLASAALSPGHIVELMTTNLFRLNTRVGHPVARFIALEKEYDGKSITDAYAANDQAIVGVFAAGSEVILRLPASAAAVVIGDLLEPVTGGVVRKQLQGALITSVGTGDGTIADVGGAFNQTTLNNNFKDIADAVNGQVIFAMALEAVDNSSNAASEVFIRAVLL